MKTSSRTLAIANLVSLTIVLIVNYLSNSLPLNGKTPGQLSDQYPNLFTPAGLTFSIWGIIYIWLIVLGGFQVAAFFSKRIAAKVEPMLDKIGWLFAYSCLLNIGWLFAWHWEQILVSVAIMANMLYILTQLNQAAGVGASTSSNLEKWLEHIPFGIYQGWITVALIANVTAWLVSIGWLGSGIGAPTWAILMVMVGALLALYIIIRQNNWGHGIAVAWALYGIYLKQTRAESVDAQMVAWVALALMMTILLTLLLRWRKWLAY